ncbi:MAG: hypothetical protein M3N30_01575 [Bacteroidota bacterium]|nr:hypothetical protein [Bacteroidota bacterium]
MIRLEPYIDLQIQCPGCSAEIQPSGWLITGMHCMMKMKCAKCGREFYSEIPVNAGAFYPGILDARTGERVDSMPFENWYLNGLVEAFKKRSDENISLELHENRKLGERPVLILNTIDATYGHAVYELFNASYYLKKKEYDLVILVQKHLYWLVPDGAAQVWVADIPFSKAVNWFDKLDMEIKKLISHVKDVFICRSFVQADSHDFNIEDYTRISPFPLNEWDERLEQPTLTFIWRTDRFWKRVLPKIVDNRYSRKLFPGLLKSVRKSLQFKWILQFSEKLKEQIPAVDFAIAGMDDRDPDLPGWIKDFRYPVHEDSTAREQMKRYANSHLVAGCNGSSLLLPGCLSGGVVNIVPGNMWAVSAGTFAFRITDTGDTHFRYVMIPDEISIPKLVNIIVSVLRDRSYIQIQASAPWRDHDSGLPPYAAADFRKSIFSLSDHFPLDSAMITQKRTGPVKEKKPV